MSRTKVLEQHQIEQKIIRMAWEIYEQNFEEKEIVIAGIHAQGYILAQRLSNQLIKSSKFIILNFNIFLCSLNMSTSACNSKTKKVGVHSTGRYYNMD